MNIAALPVAFLRPGANRRSARKIFLTVRRCLLVVLVPAVVLCLCGCGDGEEALYVDFSKREELSAPTPHYGLTYAYLPQYSHSVSFERHHRLVQYLNAETGLDIRQIFPDTFDEHLKMIERGEIDISFSNPFIYIKAAEAGAEAFARIVELSGKPDFRGRIICRSDNAELRSIEDCRGKSWIAVDPSSAGGYLFALGLFYDHGLARPDFADISFAPGPGGKQEKVVLAVYAGKYDIGSIREGTLKVVADKIDPGRIRILAETRAYPGWVYAAGPDVEPAAVEQIRQAMIKLDASDPDDAEILAGAGMAGIIAARDEDYDPIRELAEKLGHF